MTDKELIKAVQCCTSEPNFERCKLECIFCKGPDPNDCIPEMGKAAAAKLEALLAENEELKAKVPRWRPASQPPEETGEYIVHIEGAHGSTVLDYIGIVGGEPTWRDEYSNYYNVTHWMPLPSTEEVE